MPEPLKDDIYEELISSITHLLGEGIANIKRKDFIKKVELAANQLKLESPEILAKSILAGNDRCLELLTDHLTIGESYFFRHKESFDVISSVLLPKMIDAAVKEHRDINIWSAACANGEEPYSLAILFDKTILPPGINIKIYASDINSSFLRQAKAGIYSDWSFRDFPKELQQQYFSQVESSHYELSPAIKNKVFFFKNNLLASKHQHLPVKKFDLILCRNVLIYFNDAQKELTMTTFDKCLVEGGWILTSPAEIGGIQNILFKPAMINKCYFLHRQTALPDMVQPAVTLKRKNILLPLTKPKKDINCRKKNTPFPTPIIPTETNFTDNTEISLNKEELILLSRDRHANVSAQIAAAIARVCADCANKDDAFYWSNVAIDKDKFNPKYYLLQAQILQDSGDTNAACKALTQTLFLDQENIAAYFNLGMIYRNIGKQQDAKRNLKNAEKLLLKLPKTTEIQDCDGVSAGMLLAAIKNIISEQ
jgi:chemotaxis protein methyltransferase CheR